MFVIIGEKSKAVSNSSKNLCLTCGRYFARTYALTDEAERLCLSNYDNPVRLKGPVSVCTDYYNKNAPDKYDMEKIAWTIEASKKKVGFGAEYDIIVKPPKRKEEEL
jgi:hypothetical protein